MSGSAVSSQSVCEVLAHFGALHPQPASDWTGELELPLSLARFYAEVGPYGENGPRGPGGVVIPTLGNPFQLLPLNRLWNMQDGLAHALSPSSCTPLAQVPDQRSGVGSGSLTMRAASTVFVASGGFAQPSFHASI